MKVGAESLFRPELGRLLARAWAARAEHFPPQLGVVRPQRTAAVSVTGRRCELDCAHCGGHYLAGMLPLPEFLAGRGEPGRAGTASRYKSCLVSGGCDRQGRVPLAEHREELAALRRELRLNLHVGLVDEAGARAAAELAEVVSFDFVGDEETIRQVYGLSASVQDYLASLRALRRYARVVPHICLGLHGGRMRGEWRAVELLAEEGVEALAFLVFVPTRGTRFAGCPLPDLGEVAELLARSRLLLPRTPLYLGCMRPGGRYRDWLDVVAVQCGVNRLVLPSPLAVQYAQGMGLFLVESDECCVLS
ncbi:MAG: radical SAM protein [Bacillota bacterium]|nr:radical SAM protein [Bacillota bacterium]